jgi:hypothetical protein
MCGAQGAPSAHNEDAHLNDVFVVEHIRRHDCAVFGEDKGQIAATLRRRVVTLLKY